MRKSEERLALHVRNFLNGAGERAGERNVYHAKCSSNTVVDVDNGVASVKLFGKEIAVIFRAERKVLMSLAGYPTVTTRSRLNALCRELWGQSYFHQRKGEQLFGKYNSARPIGPREILETPL